MSAFVSIIESVLNSIEAVLSGIVDTIMLAILLSYVFVIAVLSDPGAAWEGITSTYEVSEPEQFEMIYEDKVHVTYNGETKIASSTHHCVFTEQDLSRLQLKARRGSRGMPLEECDYYLPVYAWFSDGSLVIIDIAHDRWGLFGAFNDDLQDRRYNAPLDEQNVRVWFQHDDFEPQYRSTSNGVTFESFTSGSPLALNAYWLDSSQSSKMTVVDVGLPEDRTHPNVYTTQLPLKFRIEKIETTLLEDSNAKSNVRLSPEIIAQLNELRRTINSSRWARYANRMEEEER